MNFAQAQPLSQIPGSPRPGAMPALRLMIVEDDTSLATGLMRALANEGYDVSAAASGEEALERIRGEQFDLVVLDIGLPGIDGFEVLRRLRAGGYSLPVLILTARDAVDDRVRGLDLGADDYMPKPFALPELSARVRALGRRGRGPVGPRVVHGPLVLDTAARRAWLNGEPLEMAAREWSVLQVLLERVERTVSKEAIIEAVAGLSDDLSLNAIEVYVSRLRAKLEPAGIRIRTVRGFGYMLLEHHDRSAR
jgi:two-component system, OmpR family, response regulator